MAGVFTTTVSAQAPTQVAVGIASAEVVAQNNYRVGMLLTNISDSTIYLAFASNTAVVGSGVTLLPQGGSFSMDDYIYTKESVNAIAHTAGSALSVQEFVNLA